MSTIDISNATQATLDVRNLHITLPTRAGLLHAVRGIDLRIDKGETLGLVGESGCGKSLTALSLLKLLPHGAKVRADRMAFDGHDLLSVGDRAINRLRGDRISMVFQEPMTALNPTFTIGAQLRAVYLSHRRGERAQAQACALHLLEKVGIGDAARRLEQYPHELSGGMRQRVLIAMALMCGPDLIVADEPTTALDVTVQKQILDLLKTLQQEMGLAILLITHDLGLVAHYTDRVSVMYAGQIVESGRTDTVLRHAGHPYTQGLLDCLPMGGSRAPGQPLAVIPGVVPALLEPPTQCAFAPRCAHAAPVCNNVPPDLIAIGAAHTRRCYAPFEARV
ncbi:ABC transporter ATP-binding protein [Pigmentiphaga aceris]|uniref:ABC transporter ATP-binding protein n=1 Tax=Pigmentiphaga aceris TaxID=1940612 RepID=UPI0016528EE6|nr:ABC transporter ATP-binding protein [Pigmentiphaga aceris]